MALLWVKRLEARSGPFHVLQIYWTPKGNLIIEFLLVPIALTFDRECTFCVSS